MPILLIERHIVTKLKLLCNMLITFQTKSICRKYIYMSSFIMTVNNLLKNINSKVNNKCDVFLPSLA